MSTQSEVKRRTVSHIRNRKGAEPLVCLTAYTAPMARRIDAVADVILVGDSLGTVIYGFDSTIPVTLDMMMAHGAAVVRATQSALVVVDMPFGSYQESPAQAYKNAAHIMKETGCAAVKLEGGAEMAETVAFLTQRGIPVMAHIGLQPQSVNAVGGYRVAGRSADAAQALEDSARQLDDAGAFAIVIECTEEPVAAAISKAVSIPTIGIGASAECDGQILVTEDMLGLTGGHIAKFVKSYAALGAEVDGALARYADDVRKRAFPSAEYIYKSAQPRPADSAEPLRAVKNKS